MQINIKQGTHLILLGFLAVTLGACARNLKSSGETSWRTDGVGSLGGESSDLLVTELPSDRSLFDPSKTDWAELNRFTIYFAFDSFAIERSERPKLDGVAEWLQRNPDARLLIAGHTDERGTPEYNRALGERRALAVRSYLIGLGVGGARLGTISYGEEKPAASGSGESVWRLNRRSELGVLR